MSSSQKSPDRATDVLRADIAKTRAELADTLDRLMAKADVKSRARRRMRDVVDQARSHRTQLAIGGATTLLAAVIVIMVRRR